MPATLDAKQRVTLPYRVVALQSLETVANGADASGWWLLFLSQRHCNGLQLPLCQWHLVRSLRCHRVLVRSEQHHLR